MASAALWWTTTLAHACAGLSPESVRLGNYKRQQLSTLSDVCKGLPGVKLLQNPLADGQAEAVGTEHDRSLSVPHKRWQERSFVKAPLADLACGGS